MLLRALTVFFLSFSITSPSAAEAIALIKLGKFDVNVRPLFADNPQSAKAYVELQKLSDLRPLTASEHAKRLDILEVALKKRDQWLDGYWMLATDAFFLGTQYAFDENYDGAEEVLNRGLKATEKCLKAAPDHELCRFFSAALLAKVASVQGIFSSLENGQKVRDQWLEVIASGKNIFFRPNVSLQGSAYYGLGLFFRLVPDFFLVEWLWGIRGNLDRSIAYHRKAAELDASNPCANLMLAVAMMCKNGNQTDTELYSEALTFFDLAQKQSAIDISQKICIQDAPKLKENPDKTCGYTQAKYHEPASEKAILESSN
jgi:tetratricopeptide (TPR) repeat protein